MSRDRILSYSLAALSFAYLVECLSPMRFTGDSVRYLAYAVSLADGTGMSGAGYPPAYPALIALLDKLHLASGFTFNLLNCVFFAIGLAAIRRIFNRRSEGVWNYVALLTLLNWQVIRIAAMPIPEPMFFALSLVAVALMDEAALAPGLSRRMLLLFWAAVVAAVATATKVVGISLLVPLIWMVMKELHRARTERSRLWSRAWIVIGLTMALFASSLFLLGDSFRKYASESAFMYLGSNLFASSVNHMVLIFWTLGSLALNFPGTRFHSLASFLAFAGMAISTAIAVIIRPRFPSSPVGVYVLSFLATLTLWPQAADRLWIPVFPLIAGYVLMSPRAYASRAIRIAGKTYFALFVAAGLAALAYSTRITLSGDNFSKVYGQAGGMSFGTSRQAEWGKWNDKWVLILRARYEKKF